MSKLLSPHSAACISAQRMTPLQSTVHILCTCIPPGTRNLVFPHCPFSQGDTPVSPGHLTTIHHPSSYRKANGGHSRKRARGQEYYYLAAETLLPKEAAVLQPWLHTNEALRASLLPSAISEWSFTFISGPQEVPDFYSQGCAVIWEGSLPWRTLL